MRQLVKHLLRARLAGLLAPWTPVSRVQARLVEQGRCLRHGRDLGPRELVQTEFEFILELLALLIHCSAKLLNYRTQCQDRLLLVFIDIIGDSADLRSELLQSVYSFSRSRLRQIGREDRGH